MFLIYYLLNFQILYKGLYIIIILLCLLITTKQIIPQTDEVESKEVEKKSQEESQKEEVNNHEIQTKQTTLSSISKINIKSGLKAGEIIISWEVKPNNSSSLIVKRYLRPLSTPRLIQLGETINPKPLEPQVNSFTEMNTPTGVHYYAVVTSEQLKNAKDLRLVAGQNYTAIPFLVEKGKLLGSGKVSTPSVPAPEIEAIKEPISELVAINTRKSVFLSWAPALPKKGLQYKIYRSENILDTKQAVLKAKHIATVNQVTHYEDKYPLAGKYVYYGVVSTRDFNDKKFKGLKRDKSYIKHRYEKIKEKVKIVHKAIKPRPKQEFPHPTIGYDSSNLAILDLILANTYLKGYYGQCISQVSKYLHSASFEDKVQAKANFFLGLCYYKRQTYDEAMKYFSDSLVKLRYPRRARFWFQRAIEKRN